MRKFVLSLSLSCLVGLVNVSAQTNQYSMSLDEAVRRAIEHNFEVRIENFNPEIERYRLEGAYSAYVPNFQSSIIYDSNTTEGGLNRVTGEPFPASTTENTTVSAGLKGLLPFGLTYDVSPDISHRQGTGFDFYQGQGGINLRQPLLRDFLINAARRDILVARHNIKISESALLQTMMDVVNRVEHAYYELIFARENIRVREAAMTLADRLVLENRKKVEVGTLAPLEEKQAESQAAVSRADLLEAKQAYLTQENVLKALITDDYTNWHDKEITPTDRLLAIPEKFDVMESWQRGMTNRPDLVQVRTEVERQDVIVRYQRNQILPALDVVGGYGNNGKDPNIGGVFEDELKARNPFYSVGVVLSFPLSTKGPRSAYNVAKAEREQLRLRVQQAEQNVMVVIDDAIKRAQTSFQRVEATRAARAYAEAALQAEERKLEAGKSTSFVVLQLQRDLTQARSEEIRALADYNNALAQISFSEGSILDRNHLRVNIQ